jgi:HlyD family secretion protein
MVTERKQLDRKWLWFGAVVVLILVYFVARSLTRDRLPVRAAEVSQEPLATTTSTNGKVEPVHNIEIHAPIPALVKAVYVQAGDTVPAGKLLMQLDDIDARAKLASADSAVKSAQANLEAATQNGTLEQRQGVTAEIARDKLDRDRRSMIWMPW